MLESVANTSMHIAKRYLKYYLSQNHTFSSFSGNDTRKYSSCCYSLEMPCDARNLPPIFMHVIKAKILPFSNLPRKILKSWVGNVKSCMCSAYFRKIDEVTRHQFSSFFGHFLLRVYYVRCRATGP